MGLGALSTAALLGLQLAGGMSVGFTSPLVAAAAASPSGHPNRANPLAGTTSAAGAAPKTAAPNPKPASLLAAQAPPPSVPMAPASLALTPSGGTLVGSDGLFEVDVPAGAVTSADLSASGGGMSLLARQVLPGSGGSAGGSGIVTYGLYLIQVLDAKGQLTSRSLHSPLTVKLHVAVLDPTRTLLGAEPGAAAMVRRHPDLGADHAGLGRAHPGAGRQHQPQASAAGAGQAH
jgi:hypothetical protein